MNDVALSPERQRLAAAVLGYQALVKTTEEQRAQAFAVLDAALEAAGRDHDAALTALETAKRRIVSPGRVAVQRALGQPIPQTVEAAQRAVDEVREKMGDINRQRELARGEFDRVRDNEVQFAKINRDEAATALLAISPGVAALIAEFHVVLRRRVTLEAALREISRTLPNALPQAWNAIRPEDQQPDPALVALWRDAIEKLLASGDAPIPGGDPEPASQREAAAA
jgi:hypothetical protein